MLNLVKMTVPGKPEFMQVCKVSQLPPQMLPKLISIQ